MSDEYEAPTLTYLGQVGPDGSVPTPPDTYEIGDYVWARNTLDETATRWLAHIESAHSIRSHSGRRWLVRVRRRDFWTSGAAHMYIVRKLTAAELLEQRRLGRVPPEGERF